MVYYWTLCNTLMLQNPETNRELITKLYVELLGRKPDKKGLEHYLWLMDTHKFDKDLLILDIKLSKEYNSKLYFRYKLK